MALPRIVEALNAYGPDFLNVYPSMAGLLADEQRAGRLRISLRGMSTSSEMRSPELTRMIAEAFGVRPFDVYATTEGLAGCSWDAGEGIHLFEDMTVVENVDADGRPVPPGEPGGRVLVTTLTNRVQPLIRFEIPDVMRLDPAPCRCGRTLVRALAVEGRADDVLRLPAADGTRVAVHPLQFGVVTADRDVREFQVVQDGRRLRLRVALRDGVAAGEACDRVRSRVSERLVALGVHEPEIAIETCAALERSPAGKVQIVVADARPEAAQVAG
jgi:phenylacetate-coenzyme A ligase PaaK-like adenylate-forming protein